ncbi:MAG: recombination protein O N-terminal domain-containing protein [Patescibacteria group bacterium]|nr:recombination protein O N-terminal domain-containing protein [Patescibacteria group bacterium]
MSVFKDEAIVLKIEKIRDKELLYTLFTKTYGKIRANKKYSKTEKSIDL